MEFVWAAVGYVIGVIITSIMFNRCSVGYLRVDRSDPEDIPYLFLELDKSVHYISSKSHIVLKVKNQDFISHE